MQPSAVTVAHKPCIQIHCCRIQSRKFEKEVRSQRQARLLLQPIFEFKSHQRVESKLRERLIVTKSKSWSQAERPDNSIPQILLDNFQAKFPEANLVAMLVAQPELEEQIQ